MGRERVDVDPLSEQSLTWRLTDDGMDLLERAGLAGLYMALRAASEQGADLSPLTWRDDDLQPDSVTVRWNGPAKPAFVKLMEWAWQVRDGVLYLPAVHEDRDRAQWWLRLQMHKGIVGTFLQSSRVQPRIGSEQRMVALDEDRMIRLQFLALPSALKPHQDVQGMFQRNGEFKETVEFSTWIARGFSARYPSDGFGAGWKDKVWRGRPEQALLLMLAPTVCAFFRLQGKGNNWLFVVPNVD